MYNKKYCEQQIRNIMKIERICVNCKNETNKVCGGCKSLFYCSIDCQKSHFKEHKTVCQKIARITKIVMKNLSIPKFKTSNQSEEFLLDEFYPLFAKTVAKIEPDLKFFVEAGIFVFPLVELSKRILKEHHDFRNVSGMICQKISELYELFYVLRIKVINKNEYNIHVKRDTSINGFLKHLKQVVRELRHVRFEIHDGTVKRDCEETLKDLINSQKSNSLTKLVPILKERNVVEVAVSNILGKINSKREEEEIHRAHTLTIEKLERKHKKKIRKLKEKFREEQRKSNIENRKGFMNQTDDSNQGLDVLKIKKEFEKQIEESKEKMEEAKRKMKREAEKKVEETKQRMEIIMKEKIKEMENKYEAQKMKREEEMKEKKENLLRHLDKLRNYVSENF